MLLCRKTFWVEFVLQQKQPFRLAVAVEEGKAQVKELVREIELEVNWVDRNIGKVENQVVEIEKDGKTYKFNLEAEIKKGWFGDKVNSFKFVPASGEKFAVFGYSHGKIARGNMISKGEVEKGLISLQKRTTGFYLIGSVIALLFLGGIAYFLWKKKRQ